MNSFKYIALLVLLFGSFNAYSREIYVSKAGLDSNSGAFSTPYRTLAKAGAEARAGDTVFIRAGTYEEVLRPNRSGTAGNPIVFQAYQGEKVVISAMQALSGWYLDRGNVYATQVDWDLGQQNFVMSGDTVLDLARWPNNGDGQVFTKDTLRNTTGSGPDTVNNAFLRYSQGIPSYNWANGGSVYFYGDSSGSGWIAWKAFITSSNGTDVRFNLDKNPNWIRTAHAPVDRGEFFLEGIREALDYQNEWYFDSNTRSLYVQLPNGVAPRDGQVQMRRRELTVDLHNRNHIEIRNLAVFGGSINITGSASNNRLYQVSSFYGNHTRGIFRGFQSGSQSVDIAGSNNTIEKSEIAFGAGTGIYVRGNNNKVLNSYVHDFNTLGSYDAVIMMRDGTNTELRGNRISRGGRDAIQAFNSFSEVAYNDVSYSNLIADDCALFYTVGGPRNIEVHHNWFHDAYSSGSKTKAAGIYLDNDAEAFKVHHNVVWNTEWSNIQINWNGKDIDIFNNTLVGGSKVMDAWHKEGTRFSNVRVWNNLSDDNQWEPQSDKRNNTTYQSAPFVNFNNGNFALRAGTAPIDAGRIIPGYTNGFRGSAPDVGAYEFGGVQWVAGVDWDLNSGPARRCYGLPGESCSGSAPVVTPIPTPTPVPTPVTDTDQCNFTSECKAVYGDRATDCRDSHSSNSVCICGSSPCSQSSPVNPLPAPSDIVVEMERFFSTGKTGALNGQSVGDSVNGFNVGSGVVNYNTSGDYGDYSLNVAVGGTYRFVLRVATPMTGDLGVRILLNGQQIATSPVVTTGGWDTYIDLDIADSVRIEAGNHTLRVLSSGRQAWQWNSDKLTLEFVNP